MVDGCRPALDERFQPRQVVVENVLRVAVEKLRDGVAEKAARWQVVHANLNSCSTIAGGLELHDTLVLHRRAGAAAPRQQLIGNKPRDFRVPAQRSPGWTDHRPVVMRVVYLRD